MPSARRIKTIVIGAGHMGQYHLDKLKTNPCAQLLGVVDIDQKKCQRAAEKYAIASASSLKDFLPDVEAAIIATPTQTHMELAELALESNLHILIEKPVASSLSDTKRIQSLLNSTNKIVQIGHCERFNPSVAAALALVDQPRYIVAERLGPFSGRSTDIDVILDLMIHDLDIVASLISEELQEVRAIGVPIITSDIDMAAVRLQFKNGTVAQLSSGRASLEASRHLRFFTKQRYISVDSQQLTVKSVRRLPAKDMKDWPTIVAEPIKIEVADALYLQDEHFINCIIKESTPLVSFQSGQRALSLAEVIKENISIPMA